MRRDPIDKSQDHYFDDPVELTPQAKSQRFPSKAVVLTLALITGTLINSTLAADISLNGGSVEFGQGIARTTACTNNDVITMTPAATFTNQTNAGAFYFNSITLSGIPSTCDGTDFLLRAYDNTSATPLALYNTSNSEIVVTDTSGNYTSSNTGLSVRTNSSTSFTITFTEPAAESNSVFKITLQSGPGTTVSCINGGTCTLSAWTQASNQSGNYFSLAASSDLSKVVKGLIGSWNPESFGLMAKSSDYGDLWSVITGVPGHWESLSMSADGNFIVGASYGGGIWTSSDFGVNWTQSGASNLYWRSVSCSSTCEKIVATTENSYIFTSADYGATWTSRTGPGRRYFLSSASSSDGTKLFAAEANGYIYKSTDSGVNWTELTAAGSRRWQSIASSADGTKLVTPVDGGSVYTSSDSGSTWIQRNGVGGAGTRSWRSAWLSDDGTKLVAGVSSGYLYTSTNSGRTWTEHTAPGNRIWYKVRISSDGMKLIASPVGGYSYTATFS